MTSGSLHAPRAVRHDASAEGASDAAQATSDGQLLPVLLIDAELAAQLAADPRALDAVAAAFDGREPVLLQFDQDAGHFFDPSVAIAVLLTRLPNAWFAVGTGALADTGHPYNLARRIASLEQLSRGRTAWVLTDEDDSPAAHDRVRVVHQLLRSWPRESIATDASAPYFSDVSLIRRIGADGAFPTAGPLNVPSSPQFLPVFVSVRAVDDPHRYLDLVVDRRKWVVPGPAGPHKALAETSAVPDVRALLEFAASRPHAHPAPQTLRRRLDLPRPALTELPAAHARFAVGSAVEAS